MLSLHRSDALTQLSDFELVQHAYALVPRIYEAERSADLTDDFYLLLTEVFERFAPDAERADLESRHAHDPGRDAEIESSLDAIERRALLRQHRSDA